jgi:hypothetical protein
VSSAITFSAPRGAFAVLTSDAGVPLKAAACGPISAAKAALPQAELAFPVSFAVIVVPFGKECLR